MKTKTPPSAISFQAPKETTAAAFFRGFGQYLLAIVCASLVSFTSLTPASAAVDGEYRFVSAEGSISADGETIVLPQDLLKEIGAIQNGRIIIKDNKIQLNRKAAAKIIKQIGDELGIEFDITISGPTSLKLKKSGNIYIGSTTDPVVVAFETTYGGKIISGNLKTYFNAKVKSTKLTLNVPITGKALGMKFKGDLTMVCKR